MADISPARFSFSMEQSDKGMLRRGLARTKQLATTLKDGAKNLITMGTLKQEDSGIRPRVRTDSFGRVSDFSCIIFAAY